MFRNLLQRMPQTARASQQSKVDLLGNGNPAMNARGRGAAAGEAAMEAQAGKRRWFLEHVNEPSGESPIIDAASLT